MGTPLGIEPRLRSRRALERGVRRVGYLTDTWKAARSLHRVVEQRPLLLLLEAREIGRLESEDVLRIEPGLDSLKLQETPNEEPGADEEHGDAGYSHGLTVSRVEALGARCAGCGRSIQGSRQRSGQGTRS